MARLRRALRENAGYIELEVDIPDAAQLSLEDREFVLFLLARVIAGTQDVVLLPPEAERGTSSESADGSG